MRTQTSLLVALIVTASAHGADVKAPKSEIASAAQREATLALGLKFAEHAEVAPLPSNLVHPFNPVAFGQPDEEERKAIALAKAAEAAALNKALPANDSELLEKIAERVIPSGTITLNGEAFLIFGQRKLRTGDRLTVTYSEKDYDVELTSIERFTFKLRLNRAEITRRINPGKNP